MKKILFAAIAATVLSSYGGAYNMYAQTLIPPSQPELILPEAQPGSPQNINIIPDISCFTNSEVYFVPASGDITPQANRITVWAYGSINSAIPASGIAWKRTDLSANIIDTGYYVLDIKIFEPEIAYIPKFNSQVQH